MEVIKIPHERTDLIKKNLKMLKAELEVDLAIDEESIHIDGEADKIYFARPVIRAIGRGFSVKDALKLKQDEYTLEIIELRDYCSTENCMSRIKARVIGREGTIKTTIERATDSMICVYGHTIAIIAPHHVISHTLEALHRILGGAKLTSVLNYLSEIRKELFFSNLRGK